MCFILLNNDKTEELIKYFEEQFKINYFIRKKENTIEIGGKIKDPLLPLIENVFKKPLLKESYNVNQCKIYSFEFSNIYITSICKKQRNRCRNSRIYNK